jgi:hypothetical protein
MYFMGTGRKPHCWCGIYCFVKKVIYFAIILLSAIACDLDLLMPTLKVPLTTITNFNIDSTDLKSDVFILHEEVSNMDIDSLIKHYGGNPDLVSNAEIKSVKLTVEEPEGTDLSFLVSSYVTISSEILEETVVAESSDVRLSGAEITYVLTAESGNVIDYISSNDYYTLRIYGSITPPMPVGRVDLMLEIEWEFLVNPF